MDQSLTIGVMTLLEVEVFTFHLDQKLSSLIPLWKITSLMLEVLSMWKMEVKSLLLKLQLQETLPLLLVITLAPQADKST